MKLIGLLSSIECHVSLGCTGEIVCHRERTFTVAIRTFRIAAETKRDPPCVIPQSFALHRLFTVRVLALCLLNNVE